RKPCAAHSGELAPAVVEREIQALVVGGLRELLDDGPLPGGEQGVRGCRGVMQLDAAAAEKLPLRVERHAVAADEEAIVQLASRELDVHRVEGLVLPVGEPVVD